MSEVFIASKNEQNMYAVAPVRKDQFYSYYAFMSNPEIPQLHFNYPPLNNPVIYTIKKYIDETHGNPGRFCVYTSTSPGQRILSDNKEALNEYVKNQNAAIKNAANQEAARQEAAKQKAPLIYPPAKMALDKQAAWQLWAAQQGVSGGNRTKHSRNRKTKKSKRVHTSKRK